MTLSGLGFDTLFLNSMVTDHVKAIAIFQAESNADEDDEVKAYADEFLLNLNEHVATAKQIHSTIMATVNSTGRWSKE